MSNKKAEKVNYGNRAPATMMYLLAGLLALLLALLICNGIFRKNTIIAAITCILFLAVLAFTIPLYC